MMDDIKELPRRNLFEIENARTLSPAEVAETFVPTQAFWRALSHKNHILLGARGSGKTALAKMLSHDHLSLLTEQKAKDIISSKLLIGVYVPSRLEWVSGLKNKPWQSEQEAEEFFSWRLNVASVLAFLKSIRSCLSTYFQDPERARKEKEVVTSLAEVWFFDENILQSGQTLTVLERIIRKREYQRQQVMARARSRRVELADIPNSDVGSEFAVELFAPIKIGAELVSGILDFPEEAKWLIALDEAEFLDESQHRIINSYMRTDSGPLVFKMTTMPYCHYTTKTNAGVDLINGDDFEYIYIDQDPIIDQELDADQDTGGGYSFARQLFNKRALVSGSRYSGLTLQRLTGSSWVLDPDQQLSEYSKATVSRLLKHADSRTAKRIVSYRERIEEVKDKKRKQKLISEFKSSIIRKMKPAVLMREHFMVLRGASLSNCYSGERMLVLCSDGNPRRLVKLFNRMLRTGSWRNKDQETPLVPATDQHKILNENSENRLDGIRTRTKYGPSTYELLMKVGTEFKDRLYADTIATDTYGTIKVDEVAFAKHRHQIEMAVSRGLLYPLNIDRNKDLLPVNSGEFRLAYVLAPKFRLLPRKGKALSISSIIDAQFGLELDQ